MHELKAHVVTVDPAQRGQHFRQWQGLALMEKLRDHLAAEVSGGETKGLVREQWWHAGALTKGVKPSSSVTQCAVPEHRLRALHTEGQHLLRESGSTAAASASRCFGIQTSHAQLKTFEEVRPVRLDAGDVVLPLLVFGF